MDCSPPGSSVHGDSPDKGCHALLQVSLLTLLYSFVAPIWIITLGGPPLWKCGRLSAVWRVGCHRCCHEEALSRRKKPTQAETRQITSNLHSLWSCQLFSGMTVSLLQVPASSFLLLDTLCISLSLSFWLCWLFVARHGLFFSSCGAWA